jgi:hypothetical protein
MAKARGFTSRMVNQVFNSFKVEIPRSCDSFKGFGETVGEMGGGSYEPKSPGETVGEMECQSPNGCSGYESKNPGETAGEMGGGSYEPKDPGPGSPGLQFPGSECRVSWEFLPGFTCVDLFPGVLLCCPGGISPR